MSAALPRRLPAQPARRCAVAAADYPVRQGRSLPLSPPSKQATPKGAGASGKPLPCPQACTPSRARRRSLIKTEETLFLVRVPHGYRRFPKGERKALWWVRPQAHPLPRARRRSLIKTEETLFLVRVPHGCRRFPKGDRKALWSHPQVRSLRPAPAGAA